MSGNPYVYYRSEMAFRILEEGRSVTLTTEKTNLPMQKAAEAIGMKQLPENACPPGNRKARTERKRRIH